VIRDGGFALSMPCGKPENGIVRGVEPAGE
jgi:hypothetical protein